MSTPPPDHYQVLGVSKDAKLPEIRSAHRKLVLKCHPDKVQDAALKAAKQDEFQKVQQAYEVLSDDTRRTQHNEQVKLFELRKEMGRGKPTPRSNPFEYEIRTAEPRANSYARAKPSQPSPKVYPNTPPRSYEDVVYEDPRVGSRKTAAAHESAERKRALARDEEKRRIEEDERERERARQRAEKESRRAAHGEKKKSRDKERRRGTEEKHSWAAGAYVEDDDDHDDEYRYISRPSDNKSSRHRLHEEARIQREREEAARAHERATIKSAPLAQKWDEHMRVAGQYMQAARRKGATAEGDEFRPAPIRRAETFTGSYTVRNVTPQFVDDESPRRSSAHKESRKSAETPPSRRDRSSRDRRSPSAPSRDAYIVEPPSPPPSTRKPNLQTHTSAPPNVSYLGRDKPSRSQTQDYPRTEAIPSLSRAHTFQDGDRSRERSSGSRLKDPVELSSAESDSDTPPKRRSHSPRPRRAAESTRYIIDNGRSIPIARHRAELRDIDNERTYTRDRSESPHGVHRSRERSAAARAHITSERSRGIPIRSATYYNPDAPDPIIHTVRPPKAARDSSHRTSSRGGAPYFGEVKFAPSYGAEHVIYSQHPPDIYRRGSDPNSQDRDHYHAHQRGGGSREVYA